MGYLIKYSETTEPTECKECESTHLHNVEGLSPPRYQCDNCGKMFDAPQDHFYLNHAYLSSCAFGSLEMAWSTDDKEKAELMLYKVQQHHPDNHNIVIEEY